MNDKRRKLLQSAIEHFEKAKEIITLAKEEEEEAYDNMPEGIKEGEKGQKMEEHISNMEDLESSIDEHVQTIEEITQK